MYNRTLIAAAVRFGAVLAGAVFAGAVFAGAVRFGAVLPGGDRPMRPHRPERGQSTVEYAILLLGAAAVAMLVVAWVAKSDVVGRLFDTVFGRIISQT